MPLHRPPASRGPSRRTALLGTLSALGLLPLSGCGGGGDEVDTGTAGSTTTDTATTGSSTGSVASCSVIPDETAGPYPGDGTNSNSAGLVNVLTVSGIVRSDLRSSVGGLTGTAEGVPMTVTLKLVDTRSSCASLAGRAIYLWHCDRDGGYSLYSNGLSAQNYLRGVQVTDAQGELSFTTVFPGCYSGRWPHMHFEVFPDLASATSGSTDVKTSQLALPAAACTQVYGVASGYDSSLANFSAISLGSDNVFRDDSAARQIATVTGNVTEGFQARLVVGIAA